MKKTSTGAVRGKLALLRDRARTTSEKVGPNPHRESRTKKGIVLAVAASALCGPVALLMAASGGTSAVGTATATSTAPVDVSTVLQSQVRATRAAQDFLMQYLTASQEQAQQLTQAMITAPPQLQLPQKAPAAPTSMQVADVAHPSDEVWLVSIMVAGGGAGAGETYQVPVQVSATQAGIITLPSRVGEITAPAHQAAKATSTLAITSTAGQTAVGFLKSWLTGAEDLNRWTTHDFTPAPVAGQLCRQVVLSSVAASSTDADTLSAQDAQAPDVAQAPVDASAGGAVTPDAATSTPTAAEASAPATVTATITCTTATTSRVLVYDLVLSPVAGQLVVSAVNPYQQ